MDRRKFIKGSVALAGAATLPSTFARAQSAPDKIRIGYAITTSGPLGPGAESTAISQYRLWNKLVNDAGGITLKKFNKKVPIELIAYDDRGQPDELIKLTERLILQDKVDLTLSPYATHMNLAAAPIVNKHEYPVIFTTAGSAKIYEFSKNWPYAFWSIAQPNESTLPLVQMCADLKKEGKIKGRVAAVYVGQQSMVEMHAAFVDAAKKAGLDVVFSKTYPFNSTDLQPLVREVMASDPEAFVAFSYPGDTFILAEQMQTVGFNPQIFYAAIGSAFPAFKDKYKDNVEGILTYDGMSRSAPGYEEYNKAHIAMYNRPSQVAAVGVYGCLQVLQSAIESVGEIDRKKIRDVIAKGPFDTVWGKIQFVDQRNTSAWAVGQWQNGEVVGLFPANKEGAKPLIFPKPKWK
jgi:branched-chain amino acid transport system substrate-binding protein